MSTIRINAASIGGQIVTQFSGVVAVPADGIITVDSRDVPSLLARGATYLNSAARMATISPGPVAASAGQIVASTALTNGTLAIAHQPDWPRQCAVRVAPGTSAITAGTATLTYVANDGGTQVDAISLVTALSTTLSTNTSKGVATLTSAIVTGLVGGTSPGIQINDTNSLGLPVDPGFVDLAVVKATVDGVNEAIGTVATAAACITPNTAPNATHTYGFLYTTNSPDI